MSIERTPASGVDPKLLTPLAPGPVAVDATYVAKPQLPVDGAKLSGPLGLKPDPLATYGDAQHAKANEKHAEGGHDALTDLAHTAHSPHAAMHAVEAGEHLVVSAGRVASRVLRSGATVAEAQGVGHAAGHEPHGILAKAEHAATKAFSWLGRGLARGFKALPGGKQVAAWGTKLWQGPGKAMGPGLDQALKGTQVGKAVQFTGSGGRFVTTMGGRLPIVGALLGGVIAVVDYRDMMHTVRDPKASGREKGLAVAQGSLSVASGVLGAGALAAAGAIAVGLTAPVSVPALLLAAAITGALSFGISFFRGKKHEPEPKAAKGHAEAH